MANGCYYIPKKSNHLEVLGRFGMTKEAIELRGTQLLSEHVPVTKSSLFAGKLKEFPKLKDYEFKDDTPLSEDNFKKFLGQIAKSASGTSLKFDKDSIPNTPYISLPKTTKGSLSATVNSSPFNFLFKEFGDFVVIKNPFYIGAFHNEAPLMTIVYSAAVNTSGMITIPLNPITKTLHDFFKANLTTDELNAVIDISGGSIVIKDASILTNLPAGLEHLIIPYLNLNDGSIVISNFDSKTKLPHNFSERTYDVIPPFISKAAYLSGEVYSFLSKRAYNPKHGRDSNKRIGSLLSKIHTCYLKNFLLQVISKKGQGIVPSKFYEYVDKRHETLNTISIADVNFASEELGNTIFNLIRQLGLSEKLYVSPGLKNDTVVVYDGKIIMAPDTLSINPESIYKAIVRHAFTQYLNDSKNNPSVLNLFDLFKSIISCNPVFDTFSYVNTVEDFSALLNASPYRLSAIISYASDTKAGQAFNKEYSSIVKSFLENSPAFRSEAQNVYEILKLNVARENIIESIELASESDVVVKEGNHEGDTKHFIERPNPKSFKLLATISLSKTDIESLSATKGKKEEVVVNDIVEEVAKIAEEELEAEVVNDKLRKERDIKATLAYNEAIIKINNTPKNFYAFGKKFTINNPDSLKKYLKFSIVSSLSNIYKALYPNGGDAPTLTLPSELAICNIVKRDGSFKNVGFEELRNLLLDYFPYDKSWMNNELLSKEFCNNVLKSFYVAEDVDLSFESEPDFDGNMYAEVEFDSFSYDSMSKKTDENTFFFDESRVDAVDTIPLSVRLPLIASLTPLIKAYSHNPHSVDDNIKKFFNGMFDIFSRHPEVNSENVSQILRTETERFKRFKPFFDSIIETYERMDEESKTTFVNSFSRTRNYFIEYDSENKSASRSLTYSFSEIFNSKNIGFYQSNQTSKNDKGQTIVSGSYKIGKFNQIFTSFIRQNNDGFHINNNRKQVFILGFHFSKKSNSELNYGHGLDFVLSVLGNSSPYKFSELVLNLTPEQEDVFLKIAERVRLESYNPINNGKINDKILNITSKQILSILNDYAEFFFELGLLNPFTFSSETMYSYGDGNNTATFSKYSNYSRVNRNLSMYSGKDYNAKNERVREKFGDAVGLGVNSATHHIMLANDYADRMYVVAESRKAKDSYLGGKSDTQFRKETIRTMLSDTGIAGYSYFHAPIFSNKKSNMFFLAPTQATKITIKGVNFAPSEGLTPISLIQDIITDEYKSILVDKNNSNNSQRPGSGKFYFSEMLNPDVDPYVYIAQCLRRDPKDMSYLTNEVIGNVNSLINLKNKLQEAIANDKSSAEIESLLSDIAMDIYFIEYFIGSNVFNDVMAEEYNNPQEFNSDMNRYAGLFVLNSVYSFAMLNTVMSGVQNCKHNPDSIKRTSSLLTPLLPLDVTARMYGERVTDGYCRSVVISDPAIASSVSASVNKVFDDILEKSLANMKNCTESERLLVKSQIESRKRMYSEIDNPTDGQGFCSITGMRKIMVMSGEWKKEPKLERLYKEYKNKTLTVEKLLNEYGDLYLPTIKDLCNTGELKTTSSDEQMYYSYMYKESTPCVIFIESIAATLNNPILHAIQETMEKLENENPQKGIDMIHFQSGSKLYTDKQAAFKLSEQELSEYENLRSLVEIERLSDGEVGSNKITEAYMNLKNSIAKNFEAHIRRKSKSQSDGNTAKDEEPYDVNTVQRTPFQDNSLIFVARPHFEQLGIVNGQLRNIISSILNPGKKYQIQTKEGFKEYDGAQMIELFSNIIEDLYSRHYQDALDKFSKNDSIYLGEDEASLIYTSLLESESLNPSTKQKLIDLKEGKSNGTIPFSIEEMRSIVANMQAPIHKASMLRIKEDAIVQKSAFGNPYTGVRMVNDTNEDIISEKAFKLLKSDPKLSSSLSEKYGSFSTYEEYLSSQGEIHFRGLNVQYPLMKRFFPYVDKETGNVKLPKELQYLLDGVISRDPTEAEYSAIPIRISHFQLPGVGSHTIEVPYEIVIINGSDFDVDKNKVILQYKDNTTGTVIEHIFNKEHVNIEQLTTAMSTLFQSALFSSEAKSLVGQRKEMFDIYRTQVGLIKDGLSEGDALAVIAGEKWYNSKTKKVSDKGGEGFLTGSEVFDLYAFKDASLNAFSICGIFNGHNFISQGFTILNVVASTSARYRVFSETTKEKSKWLAPFLEYASKEQGKISSATRAIFRTSSYNNGNRSLTNDKLLQNSDDVFAESVHSFLGLCISASVDVVKDNALHPLNINSTTLDSYIGMQAIGYSFSEAAMFHNIPFVKTLSDFCLSNGISFSDALALYILNSLDNNISPVITLENTIKDLKGEDKAYKKKISSLYQKDTIKEVLNKIPKNGVSENVLSNLLQGNDKTSHESLYVALVLMDAVTTAKNINSALDFAAIHSNKNGLKEATPLKQAAVNSKHSEAYADKEIAKNPKTALLRHRAEAIDRNYKPLVEFFADINPFENPNFFEGVFGEVARSLVNNFSHDAISETSSGRNNAILFILGKMLNNADIDALSKNQPLINAINEFLIKGVTVTFKDGKFQLLISKEFYDKFLKPNLLKPCNESDEALLSFVHKHNKTISEINFKKITEFISYLRTLDYKSLSVEDKRIVDIFLSHNLNPSKSEVLFLLIKMYSELQIGKDVSFDIFNSLFYKASTAYNQNTPFSVMSTDEFDSFLKMPRPASKTKIIYITHRPLSSFETTYGNRLYSLSDDSHLVELQEVLKDLYEDCEYVKFIIEQEPYSNSSNLSSYEELVNMALFPNNPIPTKLTSTLSSKEFLSDVFYKKFREHNISFLEKIGDSGEYGFFFKKGERASNSQFFSEISSSNLFLQSLFATSSLAMLRKIVTTNITKKNSKGDVIYKGLPSHEDVTQEFIGLSSIPTYAIQGFLAQSGIDMSLNDLSVLGNILSLYENIAKKNPSEKNMQELSATVTPIAPYLGIGSGNPLILGYVEPKVPQPLPDGVPYSFGNYKSVLTEDAAEVFNDEPTPSSIPVIDTTPIPYPVRLIPNNPSDVSPTVNSSEEFKKFKEEDDLCD